MSEEKNSEANTRAHCAPEVKSRTMPASWQPDARRDETSATILATIRAGAQGRGNAATLRLALQDKACLFTDFNHFSRLCLGDLREAYIEDRQAKTRTAKNRRLTWLAMFRYFAAHADIERDLEIAALDRQGNYACRLIDKAPPDEWGKLVRLAHSFGITERELNALAEAKQRSPTRRRASAKQRVA